MLVWVAVVAVVEEVVEEEVVVVEVEAAEVEEVVVEVGAVEVADTVSVSVPPKTSLSLSAPQF